MSIIVCIFLPLVRISEDNINNNFILAKISSSQIHNDVIFFCNELIINFNFNRILSAIVLKDKKFLNYNKID